MKKPRQDAHIRETHKIARRMRMRLDNVILAAIVAKRDAGIEHLGMSPGEYTKIRNLLDRWEKLEKDTRVGEL